MRLRTVLTVPVVLLLVGCTNSAPPELPAVSTTPIVTVTDSNGDPVPATAVTYHITSNGTLTTVTYTDGGSVEQASNASVPWSKTITDPGIQAAVSGQDMDGTSITCTITDLGGTVLVTHTSTGLYAIVSCQH